MSSALAESVNLLASSAVVADATDLTALADLHTRLEALHGVIVEEAGMHPGEGQILAAAERAENLVERMILNDVVDLTAALAEVSRLVEEIQRIVKGSASTASASPSSASLRISAIESPAPIASRHRSRDPSSLVEAAISADDVPVVQEFVGEALAHLESAEANLLQLEEDPDNIERVNTIFRGFHTIKGVAGFLNLRQIGAVAHAAENLLDLARKGNLQLQGPELDVILQSLDLTKSMVRDIDQAARTQTAPAPQPALYEILLRLEAAAAGTMGKESAISAMPVIAPPLASPTSVAEARSESPSSSAVPAPVPADVPKLVEPLPQRRATDQEGTASGAGDATVKVATDRLDALVNTVGELVIAEAMVSQDILNGVAQDSQRLSRNISQMGKITRALQELSMSMRMVPIQGVFQKMARLVRDVSRKAGKDVEFFQTGGETELDRNVVEAISDPLVHMVRNSVDHGIEAPEGRAKAGKPSCGRVELRASHEGGNVVIRITDDGRGLNKARILQKAVAAGLIKEGQELPEADIFRLIFHPGLSTADRVTDISGRGVGMDVVKRNVEALRGRIEITSTEGVGSVFTIRLPLTLAVIDGLIVKVGAERYIVPITNIEQSIYPSADQLSTVQGRGELCLVRDRLLPIVRLHKLFGVTPRSEDPTQCIAVVVQDGDTQFCLLVDELLGQQQVVIKTLGEGLGKVPGISGCAILGDGNVSLILDVGGIVKSAVT